MFKCYYNFWNDKDFPGFRDNLEKLNSDSKDRYKSFRVSSKEDTKRDFDMIDTTCWDLEHYVVALTNLRIINKYNLNKVLKQLMKIDNINILPKDNKYYGLTINYQISLNSNPTPKNNLSNEAMKQLVVSHELGHIINNMWDNDMKIFVRELYNNPKVRDNLKSFGLDEEINLIDGFNLLDEVISEDLAERVTYFRMKSNRPERVVKNDKAIFDHKPYSTNFILYGEFQDIAIKFCKTLDCLNLDGDDTLKRLEEMSLNNMLIMNIRNEVFSRDNFIEDFAVMLACMGKMKRATYTLIGLAPKQNIDMTKYLNLFNSLARYNENTESLNKKSYY